MTNSLIPLPNISLSHCKDKKHTSRNDVRKIVDTETIWQGDPISSIETFRNLNCNLCAQERPEIHKAMNWTTKTTPNHSLIH